MTPTSPPLVRALRRRDLVAILLNIMVGSGMMAAPSKVFHLAQAWSLPILAVSALLMVPMILSFCDLGSRFDGTGGPYLYTRRALAPWLAFSAGWLLWLSQGFSTAALANLLVSYVAGFVPAVGEGLPRAAVIVAFGAGLTVVALSGIRQSAAVINLLMVVKVVFVAGFIAAGIAFVHPDHLAVRTAAPPPITLAQAILIFVFAYTGFERGGVLAGEARDPQRDLPIGLLVALAVTTVVYALVMIVCMGVLGDPSATDRPLAEVGRELFGPVGVAAISAGAIAVLCGTVMVATVGMPRMLLAMAEQGQLPAVLGAIHPRWRTPHVAIILSSVVAFGCALASDLLTALTFSTAARVLCYILCCLALVRLSQRPDAPPARFKLPARAFVATTAAAVFVVVLALGAIKELPALAAALAIGLSIYGLTAITGLRRPAVQAP